MGLPRVLILGGGFGGLRCARSLKKAPVKITLADKTNHHLFQPFLYQAASSTLAPRDIAFPIREILKHQKNTAVIMDEATQILPKEKAVLFESGRRLEYDYLIVAIGSSHAYFGHPEWEKFAPGLKTLENAINIRSHILFAFEQAESIDSRAKAEQLLTFVIVGGGPTGVELAGTIGEMAHKTMLKNFRHIDPSWAKVYLIEAGGRILPSYPESLSRHAEEDLKKLGVTVITNHPVTNIDAEGVYLENKKIESTNIVWAAGNRVSELTASLGAPLDPQNRVIVKPDLTLPGHPEIFVIGDAAYLKDAKGNPHTGLAPVAIQQGKYTGNIIAKNITSDKRLPFKYKDKGTLATIGKAHAVGVIGKKKVTGFYAWLIWCFVHIAFLIGFRNRLVVMVEWMFWYFTEKRGSRLILKPVSHPKN